jgi:hypothetical protein
MIKPSFTGSLHTMTKHLFSVVGLLLAIPTASFGQSIGLNFAALDPNEATSSLTPAEFAGVIPAANWNNLDGAAGDVATGLVFNNSAGAAVPSTLAVSWSSPNTWRSGGNDAFPPGPNRKLMSGYIDTGNTPETGINLIVSNIDAALRTPNYNVYVYFLGDSPDNRGGAYTIDAGSGPITKFGSTMAAPTSFIEDPGTDMDNSLDGTYLKFTGLTGSSFTLTTDASLTTPNGFRAPINAIQIFNGTAVPPGPGDVNLDGSTNLADYNIIKANFFLATGATRVQGDLTTDGRVDLADYALWRNNAPPALAANTGVPEPSTLGLAGLAVAIFGRHRRRRRSCVAPQV